MNVNQCKWAFLTTKLFLEIDNLIESEQNSKQTVRSTKSLPQDVAANSLDVEEEISQRIKLVKKKKKAKFELPHPNVVK